MRSGTCSRRRAWGRHTYASGCSSLPTPAAREPGWKNRTPLDRDGNPPEHPNQRFYDAETGRVMQKGLTQVARMWPTPQGYSFADSHQPGITRLDQAVRWPTPRVANAAQQSLESHGTQVTGGQLNPQWVAWLMGFPIGWTDFAPLATQSFRSWQRSLSVSLRSVLASDGERGKGG